MAKGKGKTPNYKAPGYVYGSNTAAKIAGTSQDWAASVANAVLHALQGGIPYGGAGPQTNNRYGNVPANVGAGGYGMLGLGSGGAVKNSAVPIPATYGPGGYLWGNHPGAAYTSFNPSQLPRQQLGGGGEYAGEYTGGYTPEQLQWANMASSYGWANGRPVGPYRNGGGLYGLSQLNYDRAYGQANPFEEAGAYNRYGSPMGTPGPLIKKGAKTTPQSVRGGHHGRGKTTDEWEKPYKPPSPPIAGGGTGAQPNWYGQLVQFNVG